MSGPPPTPSYLKLLRGNPGKRRIPPEPQPEIAPACPEPPVFLPEYAKEEWHRIAPELHACRLVSALDVMPLSAYCNAYAQWRTAVELLARMAKSNRVTNGLLIKIAAGERRNPMIKIANDAALNMLRFAGEFGLRPVARARLGAAGWEPTGRGKFDGFISDGT
jgi:P27 family predicted phage terminase small subunit